MTGADSGDKASPLLPPPSPWATPDVVPIVSTASNISRSPRLVSLSRGANGLGFNIVGGENGEGIFVSFVLAGGAADTSGNLRRGDQLLNVNGVDLISATHEQAAATLKRAGVRVELLVAYRPEEYNRFEARVQDLREQMQPAAGGALRTTQKRSLYVRALFDYDPSKDSGLPNRGIAFHRGDILHVTNASDDEWWQARKVIADLQQQHQQQQQQQQNAFGIIPSRRRVERRERARQRRVNFNKSPAGPTVAAAPSTLPQSAGDFDAAKGGSTLERKKRSSLLQKLRGREAGTPSAGDEKVAGQLQEQQQLQQQQQEAHIPTYEAVQQQELNIAKPIVLLGPLKEEINDLLISRGNGRFVSCVPHTTRPARSDEMNGRDYHFVSSRKLMEDDIANNKFAEAGQYNGNLYGTALASVRTVAESQRHCVLDVSGNAIRRLVAAGLHPIAILLRPLSVENILQLQPDCPQEKAKKLFERAVRNYAEFGSELTAAVSGNSIEEIYSKVMQQIAQNADQIVWAAYPDEQL